MKLSETSIRRPVLASMFSAALVLFGVIGYTRLSVRELPDIDPPIISVSTTLPGANAQVVETAVTDVLEEELSTIQGLRTLSSSSSEENSQITLEFTLDRAVDVAAQDVRDKVSRVRGRLPVDVLEPVIAKQSADAQPFFWLALSSDNYDLMQISDVADRLVKARLQSLPGVGSAGIFGERRYSMRVWVKPDALSARGLTVQDVESAIVSRNVEIPAGRIESTRREFSVRSLGELKTPREFGELAVASQGTQLVKLKDVARVELGPEDDRSIFRYNGSPAVAIGVVRQSKANLLDVARNIREALPSIQQTLPPGVKLQTAWDGSVFVTHSINDARLTLLIAAILVVLIIFVFLRNVRATIIPGLAIPASIRGPAPQRVRHRSGRRRGHLGVRGAHADPDALRQDPPHVALAWRAVPDVRARLQRAGGALRRAAQACGRPSRRGTRRDAGGGGLVGCRISCFPADSPAERADPRRRSWVFPRCCAWSGGCVAPIHRWLRATGRANHRSDPRRQRVLHDRRRLRRRGEQRVHRRHPQGLWRAPYDRPANDRRAVSPAHGDLRRPGVPVRSRSDRLFATHPPRGAESGFREALGNHWTGRGRRLASQRPRERADRSLRKQAGAAGHFRARSRRRFGRSGTRRRVGAPDVPRGPPGQHVHAQRQTVLRHGAARSQGSRNAERHAGDLLARQERAARPARRLGQRPGRRGRAADQPLQSRAGLHAVGVH